MEAKLKAVVAERDSSFDNWTDCNAEAVVVRRSFGWDVTFDNDVVEMDGDSGDMDIDIADNKLALN